MCSPFLGALVNLCSARFHHLKGIQGIQCTSFSWKILVYVLIIVYSIKERGGKVWLILVLSKPLGDDMRVRAS